MKFHTFLLSLSLAAGLAPAALAHCDTWDGPVVKAAQSALAQGDVDVVLIWVQRPGEADVREAFQRALEVRKLGGQAQKLADQFFFETLVRLHRAGEGAPYTSLKPTEVDMGPAIPAGDKALETGDLKPVWILLSETAHTRLHGAFEAAMKAKHFRPGDVEAGRKSIAAYATYIHFVEGLYGAATGHGSEEGGAGHATAYGHE